MTKDFVSIAYHGFRESVNQERFLSIWNPVALSDGILFLKKNIKVMLKELDLDCLDDIVDSINVICLPQKEFLCVMELYMSPEHNVNVTEALLNSCSIEETALQLLKVTIDQLIGVSGHIYGFAANISGSKYAIINTSANVKMGLHLICHEIMHLLASSDAVSKLRTNALNGDEAVNEFFARLGTLYLKNDSAVSDEIKQISGVTYWENEMFEKTNVHSVELGLYGKLLSSHPRTMPFGTLDFNMSMVTNLAKFYFLNQ